MAGHEIDLETSALEEFVRCNDLMNESADELETLVVLEFDPRTPEETLRWLYGKLTGDAESGGSELIVKAHIEEHALSFHVTASTLRLLEIAEGVSMRRRALDGKVRVFSMAEGHYFVGKESRPRDLFTTAELQRFVSIAMDDLRITLPDTQLGMKTFPGLSIPVSEGTPIVQTLRTTGFIKQVLFLHEPEKVKKLFKLCSKPSWSWKDDDVREYFGESLGLYFSFFHFYLKSLIFPAVAGPMLFFLCNIFGIPAGYAVVISCVTNLLWITVFFELWKRKNASLTYDWGTHDIHSYHEPLRPGFHGEMIRLKNGKLELRYPRWKTMCKEYLVSYPVMGILAAVYLGLIYIETLANEFVYAVQFDEDPGYGRYLVYFPSIAYGVIIYLLSQPTRQFAAFLTSWENHATQNAWDMHLMIKLAVVEFVNLFASLFYIGFYLQNWDSLRMQLAMLLLVHAFLENISEHVIPYLNQKSAVKEIQSSLSDFVKEKTGYDILHNESCEGKMKLPSYIPRMDPNAWEVRQAREDSGKPPYESKYDDYSEIWAQFGYAFMFSAVLPWTGMFCIVANCFEIVADLFKLCFIAQRPMSLRAKNIGAWKDAFVGLGVAAVSTNCALMALSPEVQALTSLSNKATAWPYIFIFLEHCVFLCRNVIAMVIPNVPDHVRKALAEVEQTATEQRLLKLRKILREFRKKKGPEKRESPEKYFEESTESGGLKHRATAVSPPE